MDIFWNDLHILDNEGRNIQKGTTDKEFSTCVLWIYLCSLHNYIFKSLQWPLLKLMLFVICLINIQ